MVHGSQIETTADLLAELYDDPDLVAKAVTLAIQRGLITAEIVALIDELERRTGRKLHRLRDGG